MSGPKVKKLNEIDICREQLRRVEAAYARGASVAEIAQLKDELRKCDSSQLVTLQLVAVPSQKKEVAREMSARKEVDAAEQEYQEWAKAMDAPPKMTTKKKATKAVTAEQEYQEWAKAMDAPPAKTITTMTTTTTKDAARKAPENARKAVETRKQEAAEPREYAAAKKRDAEQLAAARATAKKEWDALTKNTSK